VYLQVLRIAELGTVVVATFAVCWAPFLAEPGRAGDVLRRLAPLGRGLFEDYVANFWCSTSVIIKWRRLFSQPVPPGPTHSASKLTKANFGVQAALPIEQKTKYLGSWCRPSYGLDVMGSIQGWCCMSPSAVLHVGSD